MSLARPRVSPVFLVIASITSVQAGAAFAKDLFALASPWVISWLRLTAAAVILTLVAPPRLRGRRAAEWRPALAYGVALSGMNIAIYLAMQRIPLGMAVTIEFLGPLGVAVAGSRRARDLIWVGLAGLGVALLGASPGTLDWVGVGFALLAGSLWACYILLAGPTGRHWEAVTGVTLGSWVGAIGLAPFVWTPIVASAAQGAGLGPLADPTLWAKGAAVGLLSSVIPYGLEMVALRTLPTGVFGILMSLEPAAAALAGLVVLGEVLRPIELLAMGCVIVASIGSTRANRRPSEPPAPG